MPNTQPHTSPIYAQDVCSAADGLGLLARIIASILRAEAASSAYSQERPDSGLPTENRLSFESPYRAFSQNSSAIQVKKEE